MNGDDLLSCSLLQLRSIIISISG